MKVSIIYAVGLEILSEYHSKYLYLYHCDSLTGVEGVNKAEAQKHLTIGNQLLHAGQLAEALTQFHTAIGLLPYL